MGSESITYLVFGLMWAIDSEALIKGERNNCFSKIQLVGQKYQEKTTLAS